jgi:LPS sulfotransferase NodH
MLGLGYAIELLTEFQQNSAPEQELLQAEFDREGMYSLAKCFVKQSIEADAPCASITLQWSDFDAKDDFEIIYHAGRVKKLKALINGLSPCIVFFLRRRDVLSQGISHFLASQSGYYHSTSPEERRYQRAYVRYDRVEIERYSVYTQRCYAEWSNLFALSGIVPEILYYEDFVESPIQSFSNLAERIAGRSFKPELIMAASTFCSKVSDETDNAFRKRYLAGE